jgi:DNA-binding NarL/FixJ family response regulator
MTDKISILISDDHALVRQGIRAFLELQPDLTVLGEADSGEAAEKTVKGHVSNILSKLHMMDRTQAAVYAWQQGLVARRDP